ncbi:MAG: phenylalanine--tRNA ligase subunit beta [Myxococcales bacterium]|nr:phenylalanine--tRNA ligase subunit beta [Myxococcales bacterium]
MKVSVNWLRELLDGLAATDSEIAARLTAAGLEVEGETRLGAGLSGVIVAEVRETRRHPKADKLTLVDVFDGHEVTQVVCGAPNVPAPGGKVVWARPGATLPNGITLAPKEVRGVLSPGMLCAEDELGLGASHEGILILDSDAAPGADAAALLGLPDTILELNVTPNRPDCLGHLGVARELTALFPGARLRPLSADLEPWLSEGPVTELATVTLEDAEGCPRYTARVLLGVKVGQSPLPVRLRLQSLGVRAINDVVDATNLGLLETGHPLHAFDLDRLAGHAIVVRRARPGEPITTLDGQERALTGDDLAICDAERPVAIAGVMGGRHSEVGPATTRILLESAHFAGPRIRRTARRLGLHSEASQRFERGTDPNDGVTLSSLRCARRIALSTGARIARGAIDRYPHPIDPRAIVLRPDRTERLLGTPVSPSEQARILTSLGLTCEGDEGPLRCLVPTFRPDLTREIDLIEEVARVHGYDRVPATLPRATGVGGAPDPAAEAADSARDALWALGLAETLSFAFIAPERIAALGFTDGRSDPLLLQNPLREEQSALRTSLLPGLLAALQHNLSRGVADVALFEIGTTFRRRPRAPQAVSGASCSEGGFAAEDARTCEGKGEPLPDERQMVAGVLSGRRGGWLKPGAELDFSDVKGVVEGLLDRCRIPGTTFRAATSDEAPFFHPGLRAALTVESNGDTALGVLGELHPALRERLGIALPAFAFELDLAPFSTAAPTVMGPLARFPGSSRDSSFFVDAAIPAAAIQAAIVRASLLVESVHIREDYREPGRVPPGKKGLLWSIHYRAPDRTLTDDEVNADHARVMDALKAEFQVDTR